jgi:sulfur dioxygenase
MLFRQLYDDVSSTYTYVLADEDTREAVMIDPVFEHMQRDIAMLNELDLKLLYVLDTHCHADHVTGSWLIAQKTGAKICVGEVVGAENVDVGLKHGDTINFGRHALEVRATPGHTDGCLTYVLDDHSMAFTGDALLIRGCGRCDFQQGNAHNLFASINQQIFSLPDDCLLYPAHDYKGRHVTTVAEEKQWNPRIGGGASENDFVRFMDAMQLPHPKQIDRALPANMVCGKPADGKLPEAADWAPAELNFEGIMEIDPAWVAENADHVHILDVRDADETVIGEPRIPGAQILPLTDLREHIDAVPKDKPVVTFCRSGRRSVMAASILQEAGYENVANIQGGFLRWRDEGLPVEH